MVKRLFISLLLALVSVTAVNAQSLLVGDADQNGVLSVADVTQTANLVVGQTQTAIDLGSLAYKVDNTMVTGLWWLGQEMVRFSADGTTTYPGGATYKFRPFRGTLIVYDTTGAVVTILNVQDVTEDALVVSQMDGAVVSYSIEAPPSLVVGGHECVNLGLPSHTLWATCNVGAPSPEGIGDYFSWGETSTKSTYGWDTYQYCNGSNNKLTKYCNDSSLGNEGFTDTLTELVPEDDAAIAKWGQEWRMPSKAQIDELVSKCTWTWTTRNGVNGYEVVGPNGNSLFLPANGFHAGASLYDSSTTGYYWSREINTERSNNAFVLYYYSGGGGYVGTSNGNRQCGRCVRPVLNW